MTKVKISSGNVVGKVRSLNTNSGGLPKLSKNEIIVSPLGAVSDRQKAPFVAIWGGHAGYEKALCLWSWEVIQQLQNEGHKVFPGSCGENVTCEDLNWDEIAPGQQYWIGEVLCEITEHATPCNKQTPYFLEGLEISGNAPKPSYQRIRHTMFTGSSRWYAKILKIGRIEKGDFIRKK
jgi:MOSC domain-containing protein YiiM